MGNPLGRRHPRRGDRRRREPGTGTDPVTAFPYYELGDYGDLGPLDPGEWDPIATAQEILNLDDDQQGLVRTPVDHPLLEAKFGLGDFNASDRRLLIHYFLSQDSPDGQLAANGTVPLPPALTEQHSLSWWVEQLAQARRWWREQLREGQHQERLDQTLQDLTRGPEPNARAVEDDWFTLQTAGAFASGLAEGFFVDGAWGTAKGIGAIFSGTGKYLRFVWRYYTMDAYELYETDAIARGIEQNAALVMPYLEALRRDMPILLGQRSGTLSPETQQVMHVVSILLPKILDAIQDEWAAMSPQERARLIGRIVGAVGFEVALGFATAGAGTAVSGAAKGAKFTRLLEILPEGMAVKVRRVLDSLGDLLEEGLRGRRAARAAEEAADGTAALARTGDEIAEHLDEVTDLVDDIIAPKGVANATPEAYAGVRQASQYLREAGVPRHIRKQVLESFDRQAMHVRVAGKAEYGIRYFDNINAWPKGRYLFEQFPATRNSLALPPNWNQMTHFKQFQIRPGTIILEGPAARQGFYPGGQIQKYIANLDDLLDP